MMTVTHDGWYAVQAAQLRHTPRPANMTVTIISDWE